MKKGAYKHSEETRKKMSILRTNRKCSPHTEQTINKMKTTWKNKFIQGYKHPLLGTKHSAKWSENMSKGMVGRIPGMLGKHHKEESKIKIGISNSIANKGQKHSQEHKDKIRKRHELYGYPHQGKKHSDLSKKQMRISRINHIIKTNGSHTPCIGKHEKQYLDWLEDVLGYKIIRQYPVSGYFLDGYCKERNLAIEIDEKGHFDYKGKLTERDIIRQKEIEKELNCSFLRINDGNK